MPLQPNRAINAERDKRVPIILAFAHGLIARLPPLISGNQTKPGPHTANSATRAKAQLDTLAAELRTHIATLANGLKQPASRAADADARATDLWNLASRLQREWDYSNSTTFGGWRRNGNADKRKDGNNMNNPGVTTVGDEGRGGEKRNNDKTGSETILCLVRVYAAYLLDGANTARKGWEGSWANAVRVVKVIMRAAKECNRVGELVLATKVMERAADYLGVEIGKVGVVPTGEDVQVRDRLKIEFLVVRIMLAWKQGVLGVAQHTYGLIQIEQVAGNPRVAEELADVLYEIGRDEYVRQQYESATSWLERAHDAINDQQMQALSETAPDLRMSIMHLLTKSLLEMKTDESAERARNMVDLMDAEFGNHMLAVLLKLEILGSQERPDTSIYYGTLVKLFQSVNLSSANFKIIMHHLHKLRGFDVTLARRGIDDFLIMRVFEHGKEEYIEKAAVMRIWITTSSGTRVEIVESLTVFMDLLDKNTKGPLSATATHAAQTLIWSAIESDMQQNDHASARKLCLLALHSLFTNCGDGNRAKLARKAMLCSMATADYDEARRTFLAMSQNAQENPQSRYVLYKIALRCGDAELATECLDIITRASAKDATLLYACVLEAQEMSNKRQCVMAMQKVLDKYKHSAPDGVHLPALLRCTARILKDEIGQLSGQEKLGTIEELCRVFEAAASHTAKPINPRSGFNSTEFEWFSRNSYNYALEYCTELNPTHLYRLAQSSVRFLEYLSKGGTPDQRVGIRFRCILCEYLSVVSNVVLARQEDNVETCMQYYGAVTKHSQSLRDLVTTHLDDDDPDDPDQTRADDLKSKYVEAVKYELEAAVRLQRWGSLEILFQECWRHDATTKWETLADLGFVINQEIVKAGVKATYQSSALDFISQIANRAINAAQDPPTVARWVRCLFQIAVSVKEDLALHCVDIALEFAMQVSQSQNPFPPTELEWLATTSYNHAIDHFGAGAEGLYNTWSERALKLAALVGDGGVLRDMFHERLNKLVWRDVDDDMMDI